MTKLTLCQKFIDGLKYYNLTLKDIEDNYRYAGGDYDEHNRYFKLCFQEEQRPKHSSHCVCSQGIQRNAYITDGSRFVVVGSCCINRFVPKDKRRRTCDVCGVPHQNRVVNRCNSCRIGHCDTCGDSCNPCYRKCFYCKEGIKKPTSVGRCMQCGKECKQPYRKCYKCHIATVQQP